MNSFEATDWTNPENMIDGDIETFAETEEQDILTACDGNTCDGTDLGTITKVELRFHGKMTVTEGPDPGIDLSPYYGTPPAGDHYSEVLTTSPAWSSYFDITSDSQAPSPWTWADIRDLWVLVIAYDLAIATVYCSKVEIRVTYTTEEAKGAMQTGKYWGEPI